MLDYKVLELDHGVSYGSVTLKSLQNDNIPELDLLVREAIQNSSDASLTEPSYFFKVDFCTNRFCPKEFNSFMTGLESTLNSMFPNDSADFLEIRDTKTCGLTGSLRKKEIINDDHGNFFKLVFDTGKRQIIENAGGNWGFGKSVYYRVGIGVVIFYSRIKASDGSYESRLIITLVEDESKKNSDGSYATLLHRLNPLSVGKAWWGVADGEDFLPITDQEFINAVLNVFHLSPFGERETGTSIIIPYIDSKRLLDDIVPQEVELPEGVIDNYVNAFGNDLESYLRLAIQKWYCPKIHNRSLTVISDDKKWLSVSVNNVPIRKQDMLPFFGLVQELYSSALAEINQKSYSPNLNYEIVTKPINVKNYFDGGSTVGYVAIAKISKSQLYGEEGMELSPYVYCGKFEAEGGQNEPIVMYTRDPGMIIEYSISGLWVKGIPWPESEDDFIFGFFVPDTRKKIKSDLLVREHAGKTLGEYLRSCEASDHMGWSDPAKMSIVVRIQKNTVNQITKLQSENEIRNTEATASRLSGKLGKLLLPRIGYGKKKGSGGSGEGGGGGTINNLEFEITNQEFGNNLLKIDYRLKLKHSKRNVEIKLLIDSEGGQIDPEGWIRDIGTEFPACIIEAGVERVKSTELQAEKEVFKTCTVEEPIIKCDVIEAEILAVNRNAEYTSFSIISQITAPEITGSIIIQAKDRRYSFSIKAM